ncbi:hypothetical protein ABT173_03560 [Streptomyces sp. NPDC001795]|uniref:hypothetical protein n=1 Tax=Streptomyces sp. NPDC001795 TaxID=3154525 RepID=UPI0033255F22
MSRTTGTWNTKGMWAAGVVLAAVVGLTSYVALSGNGGGSDTGGKGSARPSVSASASPGPTYTVPSDWTEPNRWAALPRGAKTDKYGSQVSFPHTTEGAVAAIVAAQSTDIEGDKTTLTEQLRVYHSYIAAGDHSDKALKAVEQKAKQSDTELHQQMGSGSGESAFPPGAYLRTTVVGYKIIKQSADEVGVWLLSRVAQKDGETEKEEVTLTRSVAGLRWEDSDWKLSVEATLAAQQQTDGQPEPAGAAPGDAKFNAAGWTAIRAAS